EIRRDFRGEESGSSGAPLRRTQGRPQNPAWGRICSMTVIMRSNSIVSKGRLEKSRVMNCPWKMRPTSGGRSPRAADFETCRAPRESIAQTTNRSEGDTEGKSERENKARNDARWLRGRKPEGVCEMLVSRIRTYQVW